VSATEVHREVLREAFFLEGLGPEVREEFALLASCHSYPKGNILFHHTEPVDAIFIVLDGGVKISLINEQGREVVLKVVQKGGVFGLAAALDGGVQIGTASTLTASTVAKIARTSLLRLLAAHPEAYRIISVELACLVRAAYEKIGAQSLLTVKERLLEALLEIARAEGRPTVGDEIIFTRPTHRELAELVGSSRVVVTRMLKELLRDEEMAEASGRTLRVSVHSVSLRD
jgi:CRP/FNR family transcriptional regulator, cyclic AMP receptor protein